LPIILATQARHFHSFSLAVVFHSHISSMNVVGIVAMSRDSSVYWRKANKLISYLTE
jgi:NO-binding membrane sensor protein with MHYT domain